MTNMVLKALEVNSEQARDNAVRIMSKGLVPMFHGAPGVGKSAIAHQIAEDYNLKLIDFRLTDCDPTDLRGFPTIDEASGKSNYAPMATFPLAGDPLPIKTPGIPKTTVHAGTGKTIILKDEKGNTVWEVEPVYYAGWLLLLDELPSAPRAVQAAAYKLVLDRGLGDYKLHANVSIMAAGNRMTDKAIVNNMGTALQSRMVHISLMVDPQAWIRWATGADIDHRMTSYIGFKPDSLMVFDPNHQDMTFACPRTWEFASKLFKEQANISTADVPLMAGAISQGVAREFIAFCDVYDKLPTIGQILNDPKTTPMPSDQISTMWALTGLLASSATKNNLKDMFVYIERMPIEFMVIALKDMMRRKIELLEEKPMKEWLRAHANEMYG